MIKDYIMKHSKLFYNMLTLILLALHVVACSSNDDDENNIRFYLSSKEVIYVRTTSVGEVLLSIQNTDGGYTVQSNDEEIATANIKSNSTISIKGKKAGSTTITVTDSQRRTASLDITIYTKKALCNIEQCDAEVQIENPTAEDQAEIDRIKAEMLSEMLPSGGLFQFTYTTETEGTFTFHANPEKVDDKLEGTFKYNWNGDINTSSIALTYNSKTITYQLKANKKITLSTVLNMTQQIDLMHDFTSDYSHLTNPKILKATATLHTTGVGFFGVVTE